MKLAIGLVYKGGKEFIDGWIKSAEAISDTIFVIDNGADKEVQEVLIERPSVKRYFVQRGLDRNMSRDYQRILDMAREEDCQWVFNLDIDEFLPLINKDYLMFNLLNSPEESIGFPLFEMRNDKDHYVMVGDGLSQELKDGRLVHKCYKVLSHFEFNQKDIHGSSIPHNAKAEKKFIKFPIQHFGHMTKEMRDEKRKKIGHSKDEDEAFATWLEEDETKLIIKEWKILFKMIKEDIEK